MPSQLLGTFVRVKSSHAFILKKILVLVRS